MIRFARRFGLAMALCASAPAWAADGVSGAMQDGYGRLSFSTPAKVSATTTGGVLAISFDRKVTLTPAAVTAAMPRFLTNGRMDEDGKTLRFTLSQPVKLHVSQLGGRAVVDLADVNFTGTMPDLLPPPKPEVKPVDPNNLPVLKVRAGGYANFTRLVFDWPQTVNYRVIPGAGKMTLRFDAPVKADLSVIARFAPAWVKNATTRLDGNATLVEFDTDSDSGYHDFRDGTKIVLDVLAPKTDGADYAPPGSAKPTVSAMKPVPAKAEAAKAAPPVKAAAAAPAPAQAKPVATPAASKDVAKAVTGMTAAQAQAVLQSAAQLSGKAAPKPLDAPADAKAADAKTDAKTEIPPEAVAAESGEVAVADAQRTREGVLINFKGAGTHPSAVFVRGLTAWIVIENAPNFESGNLKTSLGDFAAGVEAASSNGLGILRITLKAPAEIGARALGPNLQVEIAAKVAPAPLPVSFSRNQSDPSRASLSTYMPAADHAFPLLDPASGDILTVVPAAPGRGIPVARNFADFSALPTAAGLVINSYADDLSVTVAQSRVTLSRPRGLTLTAPQMPVAQSPAALARLGGGPSFLNFSEWGALRGDSFLATERRLIQNAARLPAAQAGQARITLARFYLANRFAAEALGLIKLVQAQDPALSGDTQLVTMRASAEVMMGRYREAHNDLGGPAFDTDRHAALWRGLAEAGLENWSSAIASLEQAQPVLNRYAPVWQASAHLAQAEAALATDRLDVADAALTRLPEQLTPHQALAAQLARARILSASNRFHDAAPQFAALEKSGDEEITAQAIFHRTNAALGAGVMTQAQAIAQLEKLRFRWRGDGLEMQTLRRLASLYFGRNQWREGLKSLRIAVQGFSGQEAARLAQDDMRAAFVKLFLKGDADKMKPVDSLALFYDNLDLTPIGPDGDQMIRRMSDRLIAVDLLGPASSLLAYQVDKRLDGIAKAQVATRLASVYLMDHKPDKAVQVLRESHITGLPDTEMHERMLLEARAFASLKQWDNALDLIAVDEADDTRRLRADIYWESGNWAVAGQKAEEMVAARAGETAPLSASDRTMVMRAAVAYSLANDGASLTRLRDAFTPKMKNTPDANLFAVLASSVDQQGMAFREAAAKIASIDTLQAFMKDFGKTRSESAPRS